MFHEQNPYVQFKLDIMKRAMPAESAIVFGDMYMVDGSYCKKCLEYGCKQVLMIDSVETVQWQKTRIDNPALDFFKGDFSNPHFMRSFDNKFDVAIAYEVLLHQAPLLQTLHLMLEKVRHRICIVQPMLREQSLPNTLIYLPGNTRRDLYPMPGPHPEFKVFDIDHVNHNYWLWGLTVSFLHSVLEGEGFHVEYEAEFTPHALTEQWVLWGCVAERKSANPHHWSAFHPDVGLQDPGW